MTVQNPKVKLNNGVEIPQVGLGVYLLPQEISSSIVLNALEVGYRHVDSATVYRNETPTVAGIVEFLESPAAKEQGITRKDIFYTTKVADRDHGYEAAKKGIEASYEKAKALGYIDLLLIHSPRVPSAKTPEERAEIRRGTWKALQEAVEEGKVKSIGISNYGKHHIQELLDWDGLKIVPAVNQIELHPWLQRHDLVSFSREKGIALEAYSPLTRGQRLNPVDPVLQKLADKYHKTPAQFLIRWSLQQGFITLPKSGKKERAAENIDIWDFEISKEDLEFLKEKDENFVTGWDPTIDP